MAMKWPAQERLQLLLLCLLLVLVSSIHLCCASQSDNSTKVIQVRDDNVGDKRPSVKKWLNSLITPGSGRGGGGGSNGANNGSSMTAGIPPTMNMKPYLVPVPMPMATNPMTYTYPMQHASPYLNSMVPHYEPSSRPVPLVPVSLSSPYPLTLMDDMPMNGRMYRNTGPMYMRPTRYAYTMPWRGFYLVNPNLSNLNAGTNNMLSYAVPLSMVPHLVSSARHSKQLNRPSQTPSRHKSRPIKYSDEDKTHLEQPLNFGERTRGVETRQSEMLTPMFETNDQTSDTLEEEYPANEGSEREEDNYENDEAERSQ